MKINKLSISESELLQAVTEWFKMHYGMTLEIEEVSKDYSYMDDYTVHMKIKEEPIPEPEPVPVELPPSTEEVKK